MLRLRKILLCDFLYIGIFILSILLLIVRMNKKSYYSLNSKEVVGIIQKITIQENNQTLEVKGKEKVLVQIRNTKEKYDLGDQIQVIGEFTTPKETKTKYLFDYKKYLNHNNIHYIVKEKKITILKKNKNLLYYIKNKIINHLGNNPYLNTFLLGDKSYLSKDVSRSYQENGISHLFAISGMHISLLASILEKLLKKKREEKRFMMISLFLIFYLLIVGFSPSILRGVLFYLLFSINKIWYFYIKKTNLILLILSISLILHPEFIWDIGFQYSYWISFSLICMSDKMTTNNYLISLLETSWISFFTSLPITIYHFYQVNVLGILYNLFYVPYVSIIVFPLSLIVFLLQFLKPIYNLTTTILETTSLFLSKISFLKITMKRLPMIVYGVYLGIILIYLLTKKKEIIYLYFILLIIHIGIPYLESKTYIEFIDVGQGDAILIHQNQETILLDTGASSKNHSVFYNTLSPLLKTKGIKKLTLVLSHGDDDHMGEAIKIVKYFQVEKVILNCGEFNSLEKELIQVLKKKKIKYYSCIQELKWNKNKLLFLQTKEYNNENDNSNVIYTEINHIKFLFMGDAGIEKEKDILKEYNLSNIDVLKVGHHGSNTSSSKEFIETINPKYSIISVGENNKYHHPNQEVLNNLNKSKIYRTDENGNIMMKIKNKKMQPIIMV